MVIYGLRFVNEPVKPSQAAERVAWSRAVAAKRERAMSRRYAARKRSQAKRLKISEAMQQEEAASSIPLVEGLFPAGKELVVLPDQGVTPRVTESELSDETRVESPEGVASSVAGNESRCEEDDREERPRPLPTDSDEADGQRTVHRSMLVPAEFLDRLLSHLEELRGIHSFILSRDNRTVHLFGLFWLTLKPFEA